MAQETALSSSKATTTVVSSPTITPIAKATPVSPTTSPTRNLEIPIAICIGGIVYLALLYSVILYLE